MSMILANKERYEELFALLWDSGEYPDTQSVHESVRDILSHPEYYPEYQ